jgi:1,2-diacylglycerol 3-alpha-glucosyltransferase
MNIVMMTNTYKPIVGGLEKSVETFAEEFRKRGHRVLIVAPEFEGFPCCREKDVFRVPAIQNFNGTDFSVELPISTRLSSVLNKFKPDIIHSQHPFLIGDTALRASAQLNKPVVFTYHTLYEKNANYFPGDSKILIDFVIKLSIGYANLCDRIIAPSQSIADLLRRRGVEKPMDVIPTGIHPEEYRGGDGTAFRKFFGIPRESFVVGTVSRIVPEKNVIFLARAVMEFLKRNKRACFVMVGEGDSLTDVQDLLQKAKMMDRVVLTGLLTGKKLIHAYAAMDVFAFASLSETQGIILAEAMAAGKPVVAIKASAIGEVVKNKQNGRIVVGGTLSGFADALQWVAGQGPQKRSALSRCARKTAESFSISLGAKKLLTAYEEACKNKRASYDLENSAWRKTMRLLKAQTSLLLNTAKSTVSAIARAKIDDDQRGKGAKKVYNKTTTARS